MLGLEIFFAVILFTHPNNQPRQLIYQKTIMLPGTGLCQGTCLFQVVFPVASFLLLEGLKFIGSVCMYTSWHEKRSKIHRISGTDSQNSCRGLRGLVNGFSFWKQSIRKEHVGRLSKNKGMCREPVACSTHSFQKPQSVQTSSIQQNIMGLSRSLWSAACKEANKPLAEVYQIHQTNHSVL